ncbi:unnamed protein product, partial [Didymodactylos carnosus]
CKNRTEQFIGGLSITYKCSQYRKYPLCEYELKAKQSSDGIFTIYASNSHSHNERNQTTRVPSPVRDNIRLMYENGLTLVQIKKAVKVAYPQVTSDTQIQDVARWHRQNSRSSMKFIEDLQL